MPEMAELTILEDNLFFKTTFSILKKLFAYFLQGQVNDLTPV